MNSPYEKFAAVVKRNECVACRSLRHQGAPCVAAPYQCSRLRDARERARCNVEQVPRVELKRGCLRRQPLSLAFVNPRGSPHEASPSFVSSLSRRIFSPGYAIVSASSLRGFVSPPPPTLAALRIDSTGWLLEESNTQCKFCLGLTTKRAPGRSSSRLNSAVWGRR